MGLATKWSLLALVFSFLGEVHPSNQECKREILAEAYEGQELRLKASVILELDRGCIFMFHPANDNFDCCYGAEKECVLQGLQNEERCQNITVDSSTCSANITTVNEAHAGLYKVFNTEGDLIQKCHLVVIMSERSPWKVAFFVLNGFLACILLTFTIFRFIEAKKLLAEKPNGLLHKIKHQLHRISQN